MIVEQIEIEKIIPYEKNAKKHDKIQIDNVAESIKQFGFAQPLVVDKNNNLIIGHCRFLAAKKLKMEKIPVIKMKDLSEEQVKKLRLLDNKLNESDWDFDLLADEIEDLNFDFFDIDWGLPEIEDKINDAKEINYEEKISVVIDCNTEEEAEIIFNKLTEEGYECHISTL